MSVGEGRKFDDVFAYIGDVGRYQIMVLVMISVFSFWGVELLSLTFIAGEMPHRCRVPALSSLPADRQRYISATEPKSPTSCRMFALNYSRFSIDELVTWNRSEMVDETTPTQSCHDGWEYESDIFDSTLVSKFDLVCDRATLVQLAATMFMLGVLVGALTSGAISDRIGRKNTVMVYLVVKSCGLFLSAFAESYAVFAVACCLTGIGTSGCYITSYVLGMELVGPSYRSAFTVVYNFLFSVGFMAQPALAYFIRHEKVLQFVIAIPNLLFFSYWYLLDESPRWLVVRGRHAEALEIIRKAARINKAYFPDDFQFCEMDEVPTHGGATFIDLFRTHKMRQASLVICWHWFVDSMLYYGISLNTARLSGNIFLNTFLIGAVEIPANAVCLLLLNSVYFGRRLTCSYSHLAASATFFVTIPLMLAGGGYAVTILAILSKAFVTIGFTGIYLYSAEVFPTEIRSLGIGTASMSARISGMAAPFIGGPLASMWRPLPATVFGLCACLSGGLILLLPETRGTRLFDTIADAEKHNFISEPAAHKRDDSVDHDQEAAPLTNGDALPVKTDVESIEINLEQEMAPLTNGDVGNAIHEPEHTSLTKITV